MGNCKEKLRSFTSLSRRTGSCVVVCLPFLCASLPFFFKIDAAKLFSPPPTTAPVKILVLKPMPPPPAELSQEQWLKLPAEMATFVPEKFEKEIVQLTNEIRRANRLRPLKFQFVLAEVARGHSEDMVREDFFSHESPIPSKHTAEDRLAQAELDYTISAENIAKEPLIQGYWSDGRIERFTWKQVTQNTVRHWFASLGHRQNLLRRNVEEIGVGAAVKIEGRGEYVYVTQTYRKP